jgi:hypothetical protein
MPVYWTMDSDSLPLPQWFDPVPGGAFETRMAQMVLLLRADQLERFHDLLARAADDPILIPGRSGWRAMRLTGAPDVMTRSDGWLRISFDVAFDDEQNVPAPPRLADQAASLINTA